MTNAPTRLSSPASWSCPIIRAVLNEKLFGALKAPVKRLGGAFCAVPFSRPLEAAFALRSTDIEMAARALLTDVRG